MEEVAKAVGGGYCRLQMPLRSAHCPVPPTRCRALPAPLRRDTKGHIVTNYHVIQGASDLKITTIDQSAYRAKVIGFDEDKDVAVLEVPRARRPTRTPRP